MFADEQEVKQHVKHATNNNPSGASSSSSLLTSEENNNGQQTRAPAASSLRKHSIDSASASLLTRRSPVFAPLATVYTTPSVYGDEAVGGEQPRCYHQFVHTSDSDCSDIEEQQRTGRRVSSRSVEWAATDVR